MGGFAAKAVGRFSSVLGGSKNSARGRYSLAAGFRSIAHGEFSAALGFKGPDLVTDDFYPCIATGRNEFRICADKIVLDGTVTNGAGEPITGGSSGGVTAVDLDEKIAAAIAKAMVDIDKRLLEVVRAGSDSFDETLKAGLARVFQPAAGSGEHPANFVCKQHWEGPWCQNDVINCNTCTGRGECAEGLAGTGEYECTCDAGFHGADCELSCTTAVPGEHYTGAAPCATAACTNPRTPQEYYSEVGGTDGVCQNILPCVPVQNGDDATLTCSNDADSTVTACLAGFAVASSGTVCEDIDDCIGQDCGGAGNTCVDHLDAFSCTCSKNFIGGGVNTPCEPGLVDLSTQQPTYDYPSSVGCWDDANPTHGNDGDIGQGWPIYHSCKLDVGTVQYWRVQLKSWTTDPEIDFWARDCCEADVGDLKLWIGDTPDFNEATLCHTFAYKGGLTFTQTCVGQGLYVFVSGDSNYDGETYHYLHFAEVVVRGIDTGVTDLSTKQPVVASSNNNGECYPQSLPGNANNGIVGRQHPNTYHGCCVQPSELNWWRVELAKTTTNPTVNFFSRDCCTGNSGNYLEFYIGGTDALSGYTRASGKACAIMSTDVYVDNSSPSAVCKGAGAYLYVVAPDTDPANTVHCLDMAYVQVLGK